MKFGMRWLLRPPRSTAPSPSVASAPSTSPRGRERLIVAGLALLASCLIFLIYYRFPEMPYLLLAILISSFWRIRAGIVCLVFAEGILLRAVLRESPPPWSDGFEDALRLALLGMVSMGVRALLDGLERQRRTEQRLNAELSTTVDQLRETERRQAEATQALAARHHLLQAILDSVDNGIFLMDPEGRISFANERLKDLLRLGRGEIVGREAEAAVLGPLAERCRGLVPAATQGVGPPEEGERLIELLAPTPRLLWQSVSPVCSDDGGLLGYLHVYSDIPDRTRLQELLEARVEERTRELREAQDQLIRTERLAALGQFSATMAHELRNPLNVVKLSARYVTSHLTDTDEKLQRNLSHMNQYVDRACAIINDLLAFSRLPPPQLHPVPINELVREAVLALSIPEGVTVDWALAADLPAALADARQIDQAVSNLGINALQAMPDGGRLTVSTRQEADRIEITLGDTGPGIAPDLWEKVFEPFFSTKASGTGLGLPLVREIAIAHGGQVSFQSAPGEGACFTLLLPVRPAAVGEPVPAAVPQSSSPPREPDGEGHATGSSAG
jgi:two-component system sensor kinase FixL